jgi:aspartyl protease family protein
MKIPDTFELPKILEPLLGQPLLALALALGAMVLVVLGGLIRRPLPLVGGFLRGVGQLGLIGALLLTIAQVARINPGTDITLPQLGMPQQEVSGRETRIRLAHDGHFWITADVGGAPVRFLVDTGATLTAIAAQTAADAGIEPQTLRPPVVLKTANGATTAQLATIEELRVGNVIARNLDAVIAPGIGNVNVLGMNFLSRLASWRVEGRTLILVPHHPQKPAVPAT